jgi:hypothetical protein
MIRSVIDSIDLQYSFKDVCYRVVFPVFNKTGYVPGSINGKFYNDAVPNSSKESIVYWEDYGGNVVYRNTRHVRMQQTVRLVMWLNMGKITQGYDECVAEMLAAVPKVHGTSVFQLTEQIIRDEKVFSRYNYRDGKNYILWPYDVVAFVYHVYHFQKCYMPPSSDSSDMSSPEL